MSNIKHYDDWQLKSMIATRPTDTFSYIRALEKELPRRSEVQKSIKSIYSIKKVVIFITGIVMVNK